MFHVEHPITYIITLASLAMVASVNRKRNTGLSEAREDMPDS